MRTPGDIPGDTYDVELHPLIEQVHAACKRNGLPLFLCVQDSPDSLRTTSTGAELSQFDKFKWMQHAAASWSMDEFLKRLIEDATRHGHDSRILLALGVPLSRESP